MAENGHSDANSGATGTEELGTALRKREADRRRRLDELGERISRLEELEAEGGDQDDGELAASIDRIEEARRAAAKATAGRIAQIEQRLAHLPDGNEQAFERMIADRVNDALRKRGDEDLAAELRDRIAGLDERLESLGSAGDDERVGELEVRVGGLDERVGELEARLSDRIERLEGEFAELRAALLED